MSINILDELKTDFLVYAQEVNNNRAFPDAKDGLKPVQRAALWDMYLNNYSSNKPHVKSAKVTGSVIGHLHPHGDGSVYEAVVRMSQPWVTNIPEIDFHGANGSQIGGPDAASSRYTEVRLSKVSEDGFLSNIKKDVVDFIPNFSEDEMWPKVFPAIFPRLLVNGSSGIGYTIAQDWLPHNLTEVCNKVQEYLSKGKISCDNIYPDFPTGGIIVNKSELQSIYETGKGSVILRGKAEICKKYINITELPYQVYAEPFIQKIKDLVNAGTLSGIEDICNKSGDDGLLIEIECSENPEIVLNKLYKLTDLQVVFSANQMALVDGIPAMLNLKDYIKVYVDHNINCIKREYIFELNKAQARLEIVVGLIKAISIIDKVIAKIKAAKSSESAKQDLMTAFKFTENQAKAIVDMRLGKLANLEQEELNKEEVELNKTIEKCNKLLESEKLQKKEFSNRLNEFVNKYSWVRKTAVEDIDIEAEKQALKQHIKANVEDYYICLTAGNTLKKVVESSYKPQAKALTEDDKIISTIKVGAKDRFVLISATGQMYKLQTDKIDICNMNATGMNINTLINDKIIALFTGNETEPYLFMITKNGLVKKISAQLVFGLSKLVGAPIMNVGEDDTIIDCRLVDDSTKIKYTLGAKTKELLVSDFLEKGRGAKGIVGIHLTKKLNSFNLLD